MVGDGCVRGCRGCILTRIGGLSRDEWVSLGEIEVDV